MCHMEIFSFLYFCENNTYFTKIIGERLIESNRGMTWREQTEKECRHQATNLSQLRFRALRKKKEYI